MLKALAVLVLLQGALAGAAAATDCFPNDRGVVVCGTPDVVVAHPNTGRVTAVQRRPSGVVTAQTNTGARAAYNPATGNAAVAKTQDNGVTTTRTTGGVVAKSKDGAGVAKGPNDTVCVKGKEHAGCRRG